MMLSEKTIATIKSTVPVLEVHGTTITKRFYETMFAAHPELLHIFNHANQKQGKQQAALANAVYAAALHIDNLAAILPVVKQIAHKHRSLGILPEHYPIVGKYLLAAIKDVLGDAATDDILQAWAEAYGLIADAFIGVEKEMYKQAEQQHGGWEGFRAFVVNKKVQESDNITSFYLLPEDGGAIASFKAGQYVSMKRELPNDAFTHIRQYSLSDSPSKPYYRISVKREDGRDDQPAGKVSVSLHEHLREGDIVHLSAPAGDFTVDLEDTRPVVLISGGVGLTPMMSMLHAVVEASPERPVTFIHATTNGDTHAMKEQVTALAGRHPQLSVFYCYTQPTAHDKALKDYHKEGLINFPWLRTAIPTTDASFYFCGPQPFMKMINRALRVFDVQASDIHFEFFGPAESLNDGQGEQQETADTV